jgi:hypothetical protein
MKTLSIKIEELIVANLVCIHRLKITKKSSTTIISREITIREHKIGKIKTIR